MLNLQELAEKKASTTEEEFANWDSLLGKSYKALANQNLSDEEFEELVNVCDSTQQLGLIAREFFRFTQQDAQNRSAYRMFITEVDESEFDMHQWIEALEELYKWLDDEKKMCRLDDIFGYLNCCASSPVNQMAEKRMVDLCREFLRDYGFEKAVEV